MPEVWLGLKEAGNLVCSLNLSCVAAAATEQPFSNADRNLKIQSSTQAYHPVHEICRQGFRIPSQRIFSKVLPDKFRDSNVKRANIFSPPAPS